MGITPLWDNDEHTIIRVVFEGRWTSDDFYAAFEPMVNMVEREAHPVVIILDYRESRNPPKDFLLFEGHAPENAPSNQALLIVLGANALIQSLFNLLRRIIPRVAPDFIMVGTLEEAYERAYASLSQAQSANR